MTTTVHGVPKIQNRGMVRNEHLDDPDAVQGLGAYKGNSYTCTEGIVIGACYAATCWCYPCFLFQVEDYQAAVKLRLGKRAHKGVLRGGLHYRLPIDEFLVADTREQTIDIPKQEVITKEGLSIVADGVVYFRIVRAEKALLGVKNATLSTSLLAQTKLREILATKTFEEIQEDREGIANALQTILDEATDPWGILVNRVEITDLKIPQSMQRALASEAEAARTARAKKIEAEGELKAAEALRNASDVLVSSPGAMQLRYLQTMQSISTENNSTILLPIPTEFFANLGRMATPVPQLDQSQQ